MLSIVMIVLQVDAYCNTEARGRYSMTWFDSSNGSWERDENEHGGDNGDNGNNEGDDGNGDSILGRFLTPYG